MDISRTC